MFDVVSVGHFTIDSIFLPDRHMPLVVLGGSAAYVSFAARRLDATVSVISKVGDDFPKAYMWWLGQEGIDLSGVVKVENAQTTGFELKYTNNLSNRNLRLKSRAPSITVDDLPKSLKAKAIHFAPIAGEVTDEVAEKLRSCTEWLSLDPQGLVRKFDAKGNVTSGSLADKRILQLVDIYKSSSNEIKAATGLSRLDSAIKAIHDHGVKTVIVTLGMKGAVLSVEETIYNIPAYKSEKFVDPTGAGDVFIGGFLAEYIRGESLLWCVCVGSAAASLVVEAVGPTFFGDKAEIYRRASVLYEKEIKE
ncbi:MAG: PfkB family carbohydrate kinase [Candidatus Bathyarchaeota archaeon]|nr:PfkB family carbohydrate kinase [Candidatus Bathyarchaeota archaeon]